MSLKDLFKKMGDRKDTTGRQPESSEDSEARSKEAFLKENYKKSLLVALEINRLRSRLPEIMKGCDPEQIRTVNERLERIESALKGAKVATADLGKNDELAVEVIRDLACLLADPKYAPERDEGLDRLQEALTEDWFQPEGMIRLERKLALVEALENMIKAEIDELKLSAEMNDAKAKLRALMDLYDENGDDQVRNAEILMQKHRIDRLENQLKDTRNQRIAESNLLTLVRSTLAKMPIHHSSSFTGVYESIAQEQSEQLAKAVERARQIKEKLIEDKIRLKMANEEMEMEGILLSTEDLEDIREMIREHAPLTEAEQVSAEVQTEQRIAELEV